MIPVNIEQMIATLLTKSTKFNEAQNIRYMLILIRDACNMAVQRYDENRKKGN